MTRVSVPAVLSADDLLRDFNVDGRWGDSVNAIFREYPSMRGMVFDLRARTSEGARRTSETRD